MPKAGREKRDVSQKIELLENRLDGVIINFNATLAQNTEIRSIGLSKFLCMINVLLSDQYT